MLALSPDRQANSLRKTDDADVYTIRPERSDAPGKMVTVREVLA